jgi:hypothetical protein
VESLYLEEPDGGIRSLAARLLDADGAPIRPGLARKALGADAYEFLRPYLEYTRATHADVLSLLPSPGTPPPVLAPLRSAQAVLGRNLLRRVIADASWPGINIGVEVRQYVRVTPGDSLPIMLSPAEAALAGQCGIIRTSSPVFVVTTEGGMPGGAPGADGDDDPARRFREYNLAHAEVLTDFLAATPLTAERVDGILSKMDTIVEEFTRLFSPLSDECAIIPGIYRGMKNRILAELEAAGREGRPSPDLARLTVMFEDPRSPGEVRTLHGLKRYLHQRGLTLGFRLVQQNRSTNRTVGIRLTSKDRIVQRVEEIRYSDFEPAGGPVPDRMPYPVAIVAAGFAGQLLYGQEHFPRVDIFCYGNEVHYFLSFGNHPAFLRVNFAPPLQGGMVDLEYYGVSKYELASHPDFSLGALRRFFRALGFHVQVENTRVHARYDKEHTPDLRDLREKAEALFCLAPYLLDIDWTIGGLDLDAAARERVASAWAEAFAAWGVLPLKYLLTKDRRGVIESVSTAPPGRREIPWSGKGEYPYRFRAEAGEFLTAFFGIAERLVPEIGLARLEGGRGRAGQLHLERSLLSPLRDAAARGELVETPDGYRPSSPEVFRRLTGPEAFARLIAAGDSSVESAAVLALILPPLERFLSFRIDGSVGGYEVQSARLSLRGEDLGIHVLRGGRSLAFYTLGTVLYQRRTGPGEPWESNAAFDVPAFLGLLRRANYPAPVLPSTPPGLRDDLRAIREDLSRALPPEPRRPIPGEMTIEGRRAAPGRAVGRVLFDAPGRTPADFEGAILVTPALRPGDGPYLRSASGVVSTGGGILSHAALLAAQFRKPAIIVGGRWERDPAGEPMLCYTTTEYLLEGGEAHGFHVWNRKHVREREHILREGDLAALDEDEDVLRVLGRDRDALELHEQFRLFARSARELSLAANDRDILLFRGRRIRSRHAIGKVLSRLSDPILACHAVHEIFLDPEGMGRCASAAEKAGFINLLLENPRVSGPAGARLRWIVRELGRRYDAASAAAVKRIPDSSSLHEILSLRLDALRAARTLDEVSPCLAGCGFDAPPSDPSPIAVIERLAGERIGALREGFAAALTTPGEQAPGPRSRHLIRGWDRSAGLVEPPAVEKDRMETLRSRLAGEDEAARARLAARTIIRPADGGLELSSLIGRKAANLAEAARIAGRPLAPPWFAVSDRAFREILESPPERILAGGESAPAEAPTMKEAIEAILGDARADPVRTSARIRGLWESVILPGELASEILAAYRCLGSDDGATAPVPGAVPEPFVALRSSSHEEDAELAARAGEFDTFLFIRGEKALLRHLLLTWSGLWSERALQARAALGAGPAFAGGGVIVQRMIDSRVSGVLQTVNVARNDFREIVINAGWGLGEGIVSGTVDADQVVVTKETGPAKGALRFTYATADKKESVGYNRRAGLGTIRCEAPYHKRLRPALEYAELCELVDVALRLESSYGYPLDIEFGIEGDTLWILQVRPVPSPFASLHETMERHPLRRPGNASVPSKEDIPHDTTRAIT